MKQRILLVLIALMALIPFGLSARDFTYTYEGQTITYTVIDEEARTCATKSGREMSEPGNNVTRTLILPANPKFDDIEYTLVSLGDCAFFNCTDLITVTIPNTVTSIGSEAFRNCRRLSSVILPESVKSIEGGTFQGCQNIKSINLPETLTTIKAFAFAGCYSLKSVTIPESVTSIWESAFQGCENLTSVVIQNYVTEIGRDAFAYCNNLKFYVPADAFASYSNLKGIAQIAKIYAAITSLDVESNVVNINGSDEQVIPLLTLPIENTDPDFSVEYPAEDIVSAKVESGRLILQRIKETLVDVTVVVTLTSAQPGVKPLEIIVNVNKVQYEGGETVHVATPGTLEDLMLDIESTNIKSLTVTGRLNASDIKYLNSKTGKMANVEHLDISAITLQPGDEPYASFMIMKAAEITGGTTGYFYIADTYSETFKSQTTGLGGSADVLRVYSPNLDGAFAYTNIKSIVLPDYLDRIPQFMLEYSENIEAVAMKLPPTEIGQYAFYGAKNLMDLPALSSLITIGDRALICKLDLIDFSNTKSLKKIGYEAFGSGVKSINLSLLEELGEKAFLDCETLSGTIDLHNLKRVPKNAFGGTSITGVLLSSELEEIADGAFARTNLKEVVIPEGTRTIGKGAFAGCKELTNVSLPTSLVTIANDAFAETPFENNFAVVDNVLYINNIAYKYIPTSGSTPTSLVIREGTTMIADNFADMDYEYKDVMKNITSLSLPSTLKKIGNSTFTSFSNLGEVVFPEGLEYIGESAFANISTMSADKLPESLKYIGKNAFEWTGFTQVTLPENLEFIGIGAFAYTNITSVKVYSKNLPLKKADKYSSGAAFSVINAMKVYIGAQVNNVGANLFNTRASGTPKTLKVEFEDRTTPISFGDYCFSGDLVVTNFPSKVAYVGDGAFNSCNRLSLDLSALTDTRYIGEYAFDECTSLTGALTLNCDTIGSCAFRNTGLESVTLGDNVHFVGDGVFSECSGLEEFHYNAVDCSIPYSMFELNRSVVVGPIPFSRSGSETRMTVYVGKNVRVIPDDVFKSTISSLIFEGYEDSDPSIITDGSFSIGARSFLSGRNISLPTISPIPTNTVSIGEEAFYIDTNSDLTYVPGTRFTVPASVKEIGANAFSGYEELYMYPLEPPVPDANYGYGSGVQRIYVRPEALESYLQAKPHWHEYEILPMHDTNTIPVKVNKDGGAIAGSQIGVPVSLELPKDIDLSTNLGESIVWESKDNSIASVDRNTGEITPKALGVTSITVKKVSEESVVSRASSGEETLISIEFWVTKLEMSESVDIQAGRSRKLTYKIDAGSNKYPYELETEWSSSDPDVAEVSADGTVTANGIGSAVITLTTDIGTCETIVNVIEPSGKDPYDLDGDGVVDVTDVVSLVSKMIKHTADPVLHDFSGDGVVDVSDIVMMVGRILKSNTIKPGRSRSAEAAEVPVSFAMSGDYTAMQTDIVVADGARIEDVTLNVVLARTHTLAYSELAPDRYRVIVYSLTNRIMDADADEPLFSLAMTGDTRIETEATIFVEAQPVPTSIDAVGDDAAAVESVTYFDLQGRQVSPEATGILIERTVLTDGRVLTRKIRK